MTDNTALWDKLGKTDPAHTKAFKRAGGFTGTAIKPMWSYRRMTEEFGPCGVGWGINQPTFQVVPGSNGEVMVYCTVSIWYVCDGITETTFKDTTSEVYGVGGDKIVTYIKANENYNRPERWENDDEAFKKAYTDAVTNALKMIGVGADVHMGMFDDNKYVNTVAKEFEAEKAGAKAESKPISAAEQKRQLAQIDQDLLDCESVVSVNTCAKAWASIMERDGWSKDYREAARPKFQARRDQITASGDTVSDIQDNFPGSRVVAETVREQHYLEAGE